MLLTLVRYLDQHFNIPGLGVFEYLSFRGAFAFTLALLISIFIGKRIIDLLKRNQMGEDIRKLGLQGQEEKAGTPTMGGIIIIISIVVPTLLLCSLSNIYVQLLLLSTVYLGFLGGMDDYLKKKKKNKDGLAGKYKVLGQILLGSIVGVTLYFHPDVRILEEKSLVEMQSSSISTDTLVGERKAIAPDGNTAKVKQYVSSKSMKTTIPFIKDNELSYTDWMGSYAKQWGWVVFVLMVIFVVVAMSNAANLTDGIDGLAAGTSSIIGVALAVLAYVSSNAVFSDYLNILFVPSGSELVVFMSAFIGATIGFLWYNTYPAQVFMGDTGSLMLGGVIAIFAICIRKELLLPVLAGIFVVENLSVVIQTGWFKISRKLYGEGRRVFLMAPLHHHFQKKKINESKIVMRFFLVGLILATLSIVTLKLR